MEVLKLLLSNCKLTSSEGVSGIFDITTGVSDLYCVARCECDLCYNTLVESNVMIFVVSQGVTRSHKSVILHLVREYGLSLGDLECILDAQQTLLSKLQPRVIGSVVLCVTCVTVNQTRIPTVESLLLQGSWSCI